MDKSAAWLKENLGYRFSDAGLLARALTHRSAKGRNYERLEFLGDSVLQLVVSEWLFGETTDASEGRLSRLRASLVRDDTLCEIGLELGIGDHVQLGPGEMKSGGHRRCSIIADAVEALFGAVYLDAGLEQAREVIFRAFGDRLHDLPVRADLRDPKSRLQELLQGRGLALPLYEMEKVAGKAHRRRFEVSCSVAELDLRTAGAGGSRRVAEQQAAEAMLAAIEAAGTAG